MKIQAVSKKSLAMHAHLVINIDVALHEPQRAEFER